MDKLCYRFSVAILTLSFLGFAAPAQAAPGTEGAAFLDIPVGAGPAAMGSAYTALADNAYASVWNPGALGFVDSVQLAGQHLSYLDSINSEYVGGALPFSHNTRAIGFAAQYLGTGDITQTNTSGAQTGTTNAHYGAYSLSYGQRLTDSLGVGVTGKWINAQLSDVSANAYAADVGLLYKLQERWRLAATVTNLGSKLTFVDQGDSLPLAFHLAAAYQASRSWLLSVEGLRRWPADRFDGRVGAEWRPIPMVALRTGYRSDTTDQLSALAGFTVGLGLQLWGQEFAYAWLPYGDLGNTQYFSLLLRFGDHDALKENLKQTQIINPYEKELVKGSDVEYEQLIQLLSYTGNPRLAETTTDNGTEKAR